MNVYRCIICGDSFIGSVRPSNCPFCGAHEQYMVKIEKWQDLNEGLELTDVTRTNVEKALEIELSNAAFYESAAEKVAIEGEDEARSIFRALFKVESEHASVFKKFLKNAVPEVDIKEVAFDNIKDNFKESLRREEIATKFYQAAHDTASETRAKQVFKALVEVESDHIALDKEHLGIEENQPVS
ncbi:MAG: ferritin [Actinobacteria bacterium]|nr:MAG: ferritin [Actinomycetota bacterium]